jgi:hypothetical protein
LTIFKPALSRDITLDLHVEVEDGGGGRGVGEDGDISNAVVALANTNVNRGPVTSTVRARLGVPGAGIIDRNAHVVDVVLSGGGLALPLVVGRRDRVGERVLAAGCGLERNDHGLVAGIVGTADGSALGEHVLDINTAGALLAKGRVALAGKLKVAVAVAVETTDRLTSGTLGLLGPLSLLVARRASVRAQHARLARAGDGLLVVVDGNTLHELTNLGKSGPSGQANPVDAEGAIIAGEMVASDLAAGELAVKSAARGVLRSRR